MKVLPSQSPVKLGPSLPATLQRLGGPVLVGTLDLPTYERHLPPPPLEDHTLRRFRGNASEHPGLAPEEPRIARFPPRRGRDRGAEGPEPHPGGLVLPAAREGP